MNSSGRPATALAKSQIIYCIFIVLSDEYIIAMSSSSSYVHKWIMFLSILWESFGVFFNDFFFPLLLDWHIDEAFFDSENNTEKSCLLLQFTMNCLYKLFLFDTQNFLSKERTETLMMPLVDQVLTDIGKTIQNWLFFPHLKIFLFLTIKPHQSSSLAKREELIYCLWPKDKAVLTALTKALNYCFILFLNIFIL